MLGLLFFEYLLHHLGFFPAWSVWIFHRIVSELCCSSAGRRAWVFEWRLRRAQCARSSVSNLGGLSIETKWRRPVLPAAASQILEVRVILFSRKLGPFRRGHTFGMERTAESVLRHFPLSVAEALEHFRAAALKMPSQL